MNGAFKILMNSPLRFKSFQGEVCLWGGWSASRFGCPPAGESAALAVCSQSGRAGTVEPPGKVFSWIPVQAPRTLPGTGGHVTAGCVFDWLLDRSQARCIVLSFWLFTGDPWEVGMATRPPGRYCDEPHRDFCFLGSFLVTQRSAAPPVRREVQPQMD